MKYQLTGKVSIRNHGDPMEVTKDHEEIVVASSDKEAIELSLSGFTEEEEPIWCKGFPQIRVIA